MQPQLACKLARDIRGIGTAVDEGSRAYVVYINQHAGQIVGFIALLDFVDRVKLGKHLVDLISLPIPQDIVAGLEELQLIPAVITAWVERDLVLVVPWDIELSLL